MERNISESPERWVVLEMPNNNYKIFGTWYGGYLDSDRWKLNSGVKKVEQDDEFYYFYGVSGSCYKCHKDSYGIATLYGLGVLHNMIKISKSQIKLMDNIDDWTKII